MHIVCEYDRMAFVTVYALYGAVVAVVRGDKTVESRGEDDGLQPIPLIESRTAVVAFASVSFER